MPQPVPLLVLDNVWEVVAEAHALPVVVRLDVGDDVAVVALLALPLAHPLLVLDCVCVAVADAHALGVVV